MSLRHLPDPSAIPAPKSYRWDPPPQALQRWSGALQPAAAAGGESTITIYDVIGEDPWTGGGFTARRMSAALRAIGEKPVTVEINSPGGSMFEGLAIYNLLRAHPEVVTVRVMGLAASAASLIAMAGDEIVMGLGSFLMIHNCWGAVVGDRNEMTAAAETFARFDAAMTGIYAVRSGLPDADIAAMMDAETWIGAADALARGLADSTFDAPSPEAATPHDPMAARRRLDTLLASVGVPRSERRALLRSATGMQDAAGTDGTPRAAPLDPAAVAAVISILRS